MWRVHMNTVAGNEILILDGAKRYPDAELFGMSPGILATNVRSTCGNSPGAAVSWSG